MKRYRVSYTTHRQAIVEANSKKEAEVKFLDQDFEPLDEEEDVEPTIDEIELEDEEEDEEKDFDDEDDDYEDEEEDEDY